MSELAKAPEATVLPTYFNWLADAPLFIDAEQVSAFYDAVVRPESREGTVKIEGRSSGAFKWGANVGGEVKFAPGALLQALTKIIPALEVKGTAQGRVSGEKAEQATQVIELHPIDNPQRQLIHLAIHYLLQLPERSLAPATAAELDWRDPQIISKLPRALLFLDLPSMEEAEQLGCHPPGSSRLRPSSSAAPSCNCTRS